MKNKRVTIPKKHWINEAFSEYSSPLPRVIAEFIQNSVDSGAGHIDLIFDEDTITVIDNGKGMDFATMEKGMLTLGGSIKDEGNVGGFGAAKKILLFSHEWYELHSLDNHVKGEQLDYKIIDGEFIQGTKIKIKPFEEFGYSKSSMIYHAKNFLKECDLGCDVFINGEKFEGYSRYPLVRETELMRVYAEQGGQYDNTILVRSRGGLKSFDRYVTDLRQKVIVEIKGDSKENFAQNRDMLKGAAAKEFNALVDELNVDKHGLHTSGIRKRLFRGVKSFISFIRKVTNSKESILNTEEKNNLQEVMAKVSIEEILPQHAFQEIKKSNIIPEEKLQKLESQYDKEEKLDIKYDFLVDLKNSKYDETPEEYHPATISFENEQIALLWRHCLLEVAKICDFNSDFSIGFTLSEFNEALVSPEEEGAYFLINPECLKGKYDSMEERFLKVLLLACHEWVHIGFGKKIHNEDFCLLFEDTVTKVLLKIDKGQIWSKVEEDKL